MPERWWEKLPITSAGLPSGILRLVPGGTSAQNDVGSRCCSVNIEKSESYCRFLRSLPTHGPHNGRHPAQFLFLSLSFLRSNGVDDTVHDLAFLFVAGVTRIAEDGEDERTSAMVFHVAAEGVDL